MHDDSELAGDRDLSFLEPVSLGELHPPAFSADHFGTRVSSTPARRFSSA